MRAEPGTAARAGTRLFAWFAVLSLLPILLLGAALLKGYSRDAEQNGRDRARKQAALIEEMVIAPALTSDTLTFTDDERERLQEAIRVAVFHGSVIRLTLFDRSGRVAISDDGLTNRSALPAAAMARALRGDVDVRPTDGAIGAGHAVRVVQPVHVEPDSRVVGVLELYLPGDDIAQYVRTALHRTYWRLAPGLGGLYLMVIGIAWVSTRRLRRHAEEREHESLHDPLTGLANRALFTAQAVEAAAAAQNGARGAFGIVDLDGFKRANDTFGHHVGDEILRSVAQRLVDGLRGGDTVARLGGDEFGLILRGMPDAEVARARLALILARACEPVMAGPQPVVVGASVGVSLYPQHGTDAETLLRKADAAMYRIKAAGGGILVYEPGDDDPEPAAPPVNELVHR